MANINDKVFELVESRDKLDLFQPTTTKAESTGVSLSDKKVLTDKGSQTKAIHNILMAAGFSPGYGNVADVADAALYLLEGEFGEAGWSIASAIPVVGQLVASKRALKVAKESGEEMVTLYRGVGGWHKGEMVKEGYHVSPKKVYGSEHLGSNPSGGKGIWASKNKKYAEEYMQHEEAGSKLLEFEIPKSVYDKMKHGTGATAEYIMEGIPKTYLKKVHTPMYDEYDKVWRYGKDIENVIDPAF